MNFLYSDRYYSSKLCDLEYKTFRETDGMWELVVGLASKVHGGDLNEKTINIRGLLKELLFWVRSRGKVQRNNKWHCD